MEPNEPGHLRATMSRPSKLQILREAFSCAHCVYLVLYVYISVQWKKKVPPALHTIWLSAHVLHLNGAIATETGTEPCRLTSTHSTYHTSSQTCSSGLAVLHCLVFMTEFTCNAPFLVCIYSTCKRLQSILKASYLPLINLCPFLLIGTCHALGMCTRCVLLLNGV